MMNIDKIKSAVVTPEHFRKHPLNVLNEGDLVRFLCKQLEARFPNEVQLSWKNNVYSTNRVHQEINTEGIVKDKELGKRHKLDIAVLKDGHVELVGWVFTKKTPSVTFKDENLIAAMEIKFYRTPERKKKLQPAEKKSLELCIKKLECVKRCNKDVITALLIFSHSKLVFDEKTESLIKAADIEIKERISSNGIYGVS